MDNLLQSITTRVAAFGCFLLVSACDGPENFSWENHPTLSWEDFIPLPEPIESTFFWRDDLEIAIGSRSMIL